MLFILASLLLFTGLLAGVGRLSGHLLGLASPNPWLWPWVGFFAASTLAMAISLILPLNIWSFAIFVAAGLTGLPAWWRECRAYTRTGKGKEAAALWIVLFGATIFIACRLAYAEWPGMAYDTDLYHANALRWMNEYGTPPGLANLHSRLGFNSAWLTFSAVLNNGPWNDRIAWVMPGLSTLGALLYFSHSAFWDDNKACRIYSLCMLPWIALQAARLFPALYYDEPALFLNSLLLIESLRVVTQNPIPSRGQARLLLLLAASAFMIKPMAAVSVLFAVALALYILRKHHSLSTKNIVAVFWPVAAAACIWTGKNILLTGYPLFPLPALKLPLQWSLPQEIAQGNYKDILAWARMPGPEYRQSLTGWGWFPLWAARQAASKGFWALVGGPFLAALPLWLKSFRNRSGSGAVFFFGAWSLACMAYWFLTAPDIRFGAGFFQSFFALGAAFALRELPDAIVFRRFAPAGRYLLPAAAFAAALLICLGAISLQKEDRTLGMVGVIPAQPLQQKAFDVQEPGFVLYFPQSGEDRCGNSPLPCAPGDSSVRPRVRGSLAHGFYFPDHL